MLLKDVMFPFLSHQAGVFGVAVCFKAPLRDVVSVPGRDERETVLAVEIPCSQASVA